MFENMTSSGKHLICDLKNIKNTNLLNNKLELKLMCKNICFDNNFAILGDIDHEFHPQGCSFIFLLSESHLSVHTFPEKNYLAFDLYTCRQYENNSVYMNIYLELCEKLGTTAQQSECKIIDRTFTSTISNLPLEKVESNIDFY